MILSPSTIESIKQEYSDWFESQYHGMDKKERQKLGAFYTPPELSIKMLEKFESFSGTILDPACGAGGLLAAAVIAGADPRKCYGIELDKKTALLCRDRLAKLGVPRCNIKIGDALKDESYEFDESLQDKTIFYIQLKDLGLCNVGVLVEQSTPKKHSTKEMIIDYSKKDEKLETQFAQLLKLMEFISDKECYLSGEKVDNKLKFLNVFFKKYFGKKVKISQEKMIELMPCVD